MKKLKLTSGWIFFLSGRILPSDWPESSAKSWQHCCLGLLLLDFPCLYCRNIHVNLPGLQAEWDQLFLINRSVANTLTSFATRKRTLRPVFICLRPKNLILPPLTHCIRVYSTLLHTGKGGGSGESWTREGQQIQKAGSEKTTWLTLINTCRKALYR